MVSNLTHRKAQISDLPHIVGLLLEDELGKMRESHSETLDARYIDAFGLIDRDPNQYLMVVERAGIIVATCHLTIMPSLTYIGSTRMQIEAVRVSAKHRGNQIGTWMFAQAVIYAKQNGASIIQPTTNKKRDAAKRFYENLGFEARHEGMKMVLAS